MGIALKSLRIVEILLISFQNGWTMYHRVQGKSATTIPTGALTSLATSVILGAPNQAVKTPPRLVKGNA
jgi:hypothetical protein